MDPIREARQYRLLARRMRAEAKLMEPATGERKLETARAFEKIAETFERVVEEREDKDES